MHTDPVVRLNKNNVTIRNKANLYNELSDDSIITSEPCTTPKQSVPDQLMYVRNLLHQKYIDINIWNIANDERNNLHPNVNDPVTLNSISSPPIPPKIPNQENKKRWKPNTCLVVGDSILNGIQQNRMSKNQLFKVRVFPGAHVSDFYHYLEPLMEKRPAKLIIHAGTNDAVEKNCNEILNELLQLKFYTNKRFPSCFVTISCPTLRTDNSKARNTLNELRLKLVQINIPVITNDNITEECLGGGGKHPGLHLNNKGYGRLAMNFIACNRSY